MKYVRFIKQYETEQDLITLGKIYDVIEYVFNRNSITNAIVILDNNGIKRVYSIYFGMDIYFIDATVEHRESVINGILN